MTSHNTPYPPAPTAPAGTGVVERMSKTRWRHGSWVTPPLAAYMLAVAAMVIHNLQRLTGDINFLWIAAATLIGTPVAALVAYFHMESVLQSKWAAYYTGAVVLGGGSWLTITHATTSASQIYPAGLGWLALLTVVLGPWYGLMRKQKRIQLAERQEKALEAARTSRAIREQSDWSSILAAAGFPDMTVFDKVNTTAGFTVTMEKPQKSKATFNEFKSAEARISLAAAQRLRTQGYVLGENAVSVEKCPEAWLVKVHVRTKNVLKATTPLPNNHNHPGSINDGIDIGLYEDGKKIILELVGKHLEIVGMTRAGKSALLNCLIAQLSRCNDVVLWVGAADKLLPLVAPWCRPWWRGVIPWPVFDWIAGQRHSELLKQLAAAYQVLDLRSKRPRDDDKITPSPAIPALVILLEESNSLLATTGPKRPKVKVHTGEELDASQLLNRVMKLGLSEALVIIRLDQFALVDSAGVEGNKIKRNTELRICLKTMSEYDGRAVLGNGINIDTTQIEDNALYARLDKNSRPVAGKSYFANSKTEIPVIAVQHAADMFQTSLEEDIQLALGANYAGRWDDSRITDLVDYKNNLMAGAAAPAAATLTRGANMNAADNGLEVVEDDNMFGQAPKLGDALRKALEKRGLTPGSAPKEPGKGNAGSGASNGAGDEKPRIDRPIDFEAEFAKIAKDIGEIGDISYVENGPSRTTEGSETPEPLGSIIQAFVQQDGGYVSTADIAKAIGRVAKDAPADAVTKAATKLGQELARAPFHINSRRERRKEYNGEPVRGYFLEELRIAADEVRRGDRKPPNKGD